MTRSFEKSLRPSDEKLPATSLPEHKWRLDEQIVIARKNTDQVSLSGDRSSTVFFNCDFSMGEKDREAIEGILTRNQKLDPEKRSVWYTLIEPLDASRGNQGLPIVSVQIKGVVFDVNEEPKTYEGVGWPREFFFANKQGAIQRYNVFKDDSIGRCLVSEAVHEYLMCVRARPLLASTNVHMPLPIAWGIFDTKDASSNKFGFVILGLPRLVPQREAVYLQIAEKLDENKDFTDMERLLKLRSYAMRTMHGKGFLIGYRHFGNISLTYDGDIFMHDVGSSNCLFQEDFYNQSQFVAEAFAQLVYSVTPRKVVIPVPPKNAAATRVAIDFLDDYIKASLQGYYSNDIRASQITFEEFQETFFESLDRPLNEINTLVAKIHFESFK